MLMCGLWFRVCTLDGFQTGWKIEEKQTETNNKLRQRRTTKQRIRKESTEIQIEMEEMMEQGDKVGGGGWEASSQETAHYSDLTTMEPA